MKSQKILILGANGMLGQYFGQILPPDFQVIKTDKDKIDLFFTTEMKKKILDINPNIIINCVAWNGVDAAKNSDNQNMVFKLNGSVVGELAKIAKEIGAFFITFSSDYVFDGESNTAYMENSKPHPINKYGESKVLGEKLTKDNTNKFFIIRTSRIFGQKGTSHIAKENFIQALINKAKIDQRKPLHVIEDEFSCPTYALDLAKAVKEMIIKKYPNGIYHLTNKTLSGGISWYEEIKFTFDFLQIKNKLIPVPATYFQRPAKRPPYSVLYNTQLPPLRPWKEAVDDYLKTISFLTKRKNTSGEIYYEIGGY